MASRQTVKEALHHRPEKGCGRETALKVVEGKGGWETGQPGKENAMADCKNMKCYRVAIVETRRKVVVLPAADEREAHQRVMDAWNNTEYTLDEDDFEGVEVHVLGETVNFEPEQEPCRKEELKSAETKRAEVKRL